MATILEKLDKLNIATDHKVVMNIVSEGHYAKYGADGFEKEKFAEGDMAEVLATLLLTEELYTDQERTNNWNLDQWNYDSLAFVSNANAECGTDWSHLSVSELASLIRENYYEIYDIEVSLDTDEDYCTEGEVSFSIEWPLTAEQIQHVSSSIYGLDASVTFVVETDMGRLTLS